jgi:hypothetical protein
MGFGEFGNTSGNHIDRPHWSISLFIMRSLPFTAIVSHDMVLSRFRIDFYARQQGFEISG